MQKIIRIARLELSMLFYSPIAWLVLIIFAIQSGVTFTEQLYAQETSQQLARPLANITKVLFAGDKGVLKIIQDSLYLYIPLLTMGLFSRETSSGSIKLLQSSPITVVEIVFGKFLSMMGYAMFLVLVLLGLTTAGCFSVASLDVKFVIGGIFGLYLLICAYTAIGLFMSSLTSYQVVAAISTLTVLAALNFIGEIGQSIDLIRELTYWLSMSGRTENMINGLITSKDVIYFLLVIGFFVTLTILKLNAGKQTHSKGFKVIRFAGIVAVISVLGYISSLPSLTAYFDTTRFKDRTLSEKTQALVKRLEHPISMVSYSNILHNSAGFGVPKNRMSDLGQFEGYQRFLPDFKMEYVPYYDTLRYNSDTTKTLVEKAKNAADALGFNFDKLLTAEQLKKQVDLTGEENGFVREITYNGKKTFLRMYNDMFVYPREAEINAAITRLLDGQAFAGMLTGNDERSSANFSERGYAAITKEHSTRAALFNQGFDVIDVDINAGEIPSNLTVLVIADPLIPFTTAQLAKINAYLDRGGNMLIAGEPGRQSILNPLLAKFEIKMLEGTLLHQSVDFELDLVPGAFTKAAELHKLSFYEEAAVTFPGVAPLTFENKGPFQKDPILISDGVRSWNKLGTFDLKNKIEFNPATETKASYPLAIAVTRTLGKKQQKIMVIGDADYMSNTEMSRNNLRTVNPSFVVKMFKWFSDGMYPVGNSRPKSIDTTILVNRDMVNFQKILFLGVIPILLAVAGGVLLVRRKRN